MYGSGGICCPQRALPFSVVRGCHPGVQFKHLVEGGFGLEAGVIGHV